LAALNQVQMTPAEVEEMYQVMAIANYEDRFVIPSTHREYAENTFDVRGGCGFRFGNGCSDGDSEAASLAAPKSAPSQSRRRCEPWHSFQNNIIRASLSLRVLARLLAYPDAAIAR
jgi:nitrate reductase beta subunit